MPRSFPAGGPRWFGLIVRYTDDRNYYYVTVRNSNVVELKRMFNGTFQTLSSASLPVTLNRSYNVRLEAIGTLLRVFVNGQQIVTARDDAMASGRAGLAMFRTQADFDNVLISANPRIQFVERFDQASDRSAWTVFGDSDPSQLLWYFSTNGFHQDSLLGDAIAIAGEPTDDQIIRTSLRATSFASGARWIGVIGRYVDQDNYYYVTLRSDNTISLRKLTNRTIGVLDTAALPVSVGAEYHIRLDLIGTKLRAYVNDRLLLEATDSTHREGRYGLATYKATAQAADFSAALP